MHCCSKVCRFLIPFRMPQISYLTLSFKCFSSKTIAPVWESDTCFSHPIHWGQVLSYTHSCFSLTSFILPNFVWFYMFFSAGQVLLSVLSWCSASTSVSEGVILTSVERDVLHVHLLLCHLVLFLKLNNLLARHPIFSFFTKHHKLFTLFCCQNK